MFIEHSNNILKIATLFRLWDFFEIIFVIIYRKIKTLNSLFIFNNQPAFSSTPSENSTNVCDIWLDQTYL